MRIIHVVHSYYPKVGGIEKVVQYLAEEQAKMGHCVTVITSNLDAAGSPKAEVINGVEVIRLRSRKLWYNDLLMPIEEPVITDSDVVHVHSQNSLFMVQTAKKLKEKTGSKIVFYFMAVDAFKNHPNLFLRLLAPYYGRRSTREALELADLPLVRSLRDLEILKNAYDVDATFLPDGVQDSLLSSNNRNPEEFRQKFGIKQENFFLFIGRMHKLKGPQILVKALKYAGEDVAVIFIGPDGGYLKQTLNLAKKLGVKERTYMLGYVDEESKIQALDSAVALVLPSIADYVEVYPGVISEAWAREKPVIASSVGGIPYRVKQPVNGILVEPSNPKMLADAMLELVGNDKLAEEMGRNGKADVFSWESIAKKSVELYRHVLGDAEA